MNRYPRPTALAIASVLALYAFGADAASRNDLYQQDLSAIKQSNATLAASG